MSYETIEIESKDADRIHVLTGTIVSTGDGVAEVNIDDCGIYSDVPVFYHCPESETADGMPFSTDDRVIIVNSGDAVTLSISEMKVVGFEDGLPRECGFRIKLYRGDGVLITGRQIYDLVTGLPIIDPDRPGDILNYLRLRNSSETLQPLQPQTITYNPKTDYWTLSINKEEIIDPSGYWIEWSCCYGVPGNYPYRYMRDLYDVGVLGDQRKTEDLKKGGTFIDIIPYKRGKMDYDPYSEYGTYSAAAKCWGVESVSVPYYVFYSSGGSGGGGHGWILSCEAYSRVATVWNQYGYSSLKNANVYFPSVIAEAIAISLSKDKTPIPDWDAFYAKFPGILKGEEGIGSETFYAYYTPVNPDYCGDIIYWVWEWIVSVR